MDAPVEPATPSKRERRRPSAGQLIRSRSRNCHRRVAFWRTVLSLDRSTLPALGIGCVWGFKTISHGRLEPTQSFPSTQSYAEKQYLAYAIFTPHNTEIRRKERLKSGGGKHVAMTILPVGAMSVATRAHTVCTESVCSL